MNLKKNARIGIWGYGVVGKAIINYLYNKEYQLSIMDQRIFTAEESAELTQKNIIIYNEKDKNQFFISHDYFFFSPGVNIGTDYATHKERCLHELDFFQFNFNNPIIAVTGSIGKTSVMHLLAGLLKCANIPACIGGNIGTAMFDLLSHHDSVDYALLEVSSFQLNHCTTFAPQLAIFTNFYPNHLDHHATVEEYFLAKQNIFLHQKPYQNPLINLSLRDKITRNNRQNFFYFTDTKPSQIILASLKNNESVYYRADNIVIKYCKNNAIPIITLTNELLTLSFIENIILIVAAADILAINPTLLLHIPHTTNLPEHRLEKVTTINNIDFYNDSKSTTTASTLAAVEKLKNRPLHLFLGGLSKGVNRECFVAQLKSSVKYIYCFGKEAEDLYNFCKNNNIPAGKFTNLENAFNTCIKNTQPGDVVLLSPAGSSYDLYTNFEERGTHFKNLIKKN